MVFELLASVCWPRSSTGWADPRSARSHQDSVVLRQALGWRESNLGSAHQTSQRGGQRDKGHEYTQSSAQPLPLGLSLHVHELLHLSPWKHDLRVRVLAVLLRVVPLHLLHRGLHVVYAVVRHPLIGRHWTRRSRGVRKRALPRVSVVHPLREETPM